MKTTCVILLTLIGFLTFGQEKNIGQIDHEVRAIELDSTLKKIEFDWVKLTGITTDGGGILKVWHNDNQIYKIVEEIGLSYGRINTTIYLNNKIPIKIIETEENFEHKGDKLDYDKLNEIHQLIIYVLNWKNDSLDIIHLGKRNMSKPKPSISELAKTVINRAEKAIAE